MKKNRVYLLAVVLLVSFVSLGIFSCSKKKKLTLSSLIISVTPNPASVTVGNTENFIATALRDGDPTEVDFSWSVNSDTPGSTVGTITAEGVFTAGSTSGEGTVVASAEGDSGSADVTVSGPIIVTFPFYVYKDENDLANHYCCSYWEGDTSLTGMEMGQCAINPHSGTTCLKFTFCYDSYWWSAFWWEEPADFMKNSGVPGPGKGYKLTGASKLTFWARRETNDPSTQFLFGLGYENKNGGSDSCGYIRSQPDLALTQSWQQFTIPLGVKDLSYISGGFEAASWGAKGDKVVIYLDDIMFEE